MYMHILISLPVKCKIIKRLVNLTVDLKNLTWLTSMNSTDVKYFNNLFYFWRNDS